jgi:hypothetical protein
MNFIKKVFAKQPGTFFLFVGFFLKTKNSFLSPSFQLLSTQSEMFQWIESGSA